MCVGGVVLCFYISTRCKRGIVVLVQKTGMRKEIRAPNLQFEKLHRNRKREGKMV